MDRKLIAAIILCTGSAVFAAEPVLISAKQGNHKMIPADSSHPSVSGDGQVVAFESMAGLVSDDKNKSRDVYIFDFKSKKLKRLGFSEKKRQGGGPNVSTDGTMVVFHSYDPFNAKSDAPQGADLFIYDRNAATITWSLRGVLGKRIDGESIFPRFVLNQRRLLFTSNSTQLNSLATNGISQIYLVTVESGELQILSQPKKGAVSNRVCGNPRISSNGRIVGYVSAGTNYKPDVPPDSLSSHLYMVDRDSGTVSRVDVFEKGFDPAAWEVGGFDMDGSGNRVVFQARHRGEDDAEKNTIDTDLFLYERSSDTVKIITTGIFSGRSRSPSLSADGNYLAFLIRGTGIVIHDFSTDRWLKIAEGDCEGPLISADGGSVVFERRDKKSKNIYWVKNPLKK